MTSSSDDLGPRSAEALFAVWLARQEAGETTDIEQLCREHPGAESELRALHDYLVTVESWRRPQARMWERFGPGVDPQVTLEREEDLPSEKSAGGRARLGGRSPRSTRYRVQGEVAHGGMGAILRVWDEDLRRHLAMKVLLQREAESLGGEPAPIDTHSLTRFLEEAQVTGQLDHPGVVPVHEVGLDAEGRVFFTMKLVRGKTLKQVFDELARGEGNWTQTRVLGLILKICEAMSYAHAKGVIHRDLKPANVMVGSFGEVFVMDWGLAKVLAREDRRDIRIRAGPRAAASAPDSGSSAQGSEPPDSPLRTMEGDVVGTPAYMPPEQARGDLAAMGPHSDVYAVGAMLYHLLAGHMPYVPRGEKASNLEVWRWVIAREPEPLETSVRASAAELTAICERAMARDPSSRYPDMAALSTDLSAYVEGRVVQAYERGAWAEARKWILRNRALASALAAAVLLLAGGLVASLKEKARADDKAEEAQANLVLAQDNERLARAETAKVLRLSDVKLLQELESDSEALWPPYPEQITALQAWLDRARALAGNLAAHRATLEQMRGQALDWSPEERARDRETHPRRLELSAQSAELERTVAHIERGLEGDARAKAEQHVAELEGQIAALKDEVEARRTWSFPTNEDAWQHDVLAELISELERLESGLLAEDAINSDSGWSVPKRLALARALEAGFRAGEEYERAWSSALPALRTAYPQLELEPQMGLVPLGPDPESGLWEFAHLATGEPPQRGADGKLALAEASSVVLVLLPGGTFWMGAQSKDANGRNYDPDARDLERPVHSVEVGPFFLSKYELTQGQWLRLSGANPSYFSNSKQAPTLLHPVERVSWQDCMRWLPRAGLSLPSEAQWEYAARAGTTTVWWTGSDRESLRAMHAANLADQAGARLGATWTSISEWPDLDDGYGAHAPIGTYSPNAFGLCEIAGNLWEWCLDGFDELFYANSPRREPLSPWEGTLARAIRGGGFDAAARAARSAYRAHYSPTIADDALGVRPALQLARR